jgi:hydrogenase-4 component B
LIFNNLILFLLTAIFYSVGGVSAAAIASDRRRKEGSKYYSTSLMSYTPAIIASSFAIILSLNTIIAGDTTRFFIHNVLPFIDFDIRIDGIASFFMFILGIVSLAVSIYSIGYSKTLTSDKIKNIEASPPFAFLFNVFILSMIFVIVSNNAFLFLFSWEIMSITSFLFIIQDGRSETNVKSSLEYLVITQVGTACIVALFMVMFSQTGSFSFDSFTKFSSSSLPTSQVEVIKNVVFVLGFIGFGIKAGMVPFHRWIPRSYPLVPNNVSALMSGVMIKMAIYGLVRMLLELNSIGRSPDYVWWGMTMVSAGSASAVIGVLYAIISNNMKTTIAFSSVENMGIIFIGLGLSIIFHSYGLIQLYNLAILASMFHAVNHALFKSLLFMGAGSVESRTQTTNMESLGGLAKKMPYTSLIFLISSISIAGLPPFNGFLSEWLTMQALLFTSEIPSTILKVSLGFASLAFALSIGTSAAVFVKVFGISFLARARSNLSLSAKEVPKAMLFSKSILALLCILFGIIPSIGINFISTAFDLKSNQLDLFGTIELQKNSKHNFASLSMPSIVAMLGSMGAATSGFVYVISRKKKDIITKAAPSSSSVPSAAAAST